jgi:hypothetical protein
MIELAMFIPEAKLCKIGGRLTNELYLCPPA